FYKIRFMPWNKKFVQTELRKLPIADCYIAISTSMHTALIVISRNYSNGRKAWVFFVIDLACRGILGFDNHFDTSKKRFKKPLEQRDFRYERTCYQRVHNIIYGALKFGKYYGFQIDRKKWEKTQYILNEYEGKDLSQKFRFGIDGIPYYLPPPDESEETKEKMLNILDETAGEDGYKYLPEELQGEFYVKFESDGKGLET